MSTGTVRPFVDFNTTNDSGENNAAAVQPIVNGEVVNATVMNRTPENLRVRTEAIRNRQTDSLYLENADRARLVAGPGKVTWPGSTTAGQSGIPTINDTLWIMPMLTPGFAQTPPVPPVASAFGVIHLQRATGPSNAIAVTSQRRSYAAGDQINITVTPGGVFSCTLDTEDTGTYRRTIKIVATGATSLGTVITALNGLTPPAPDNTVLVSAALEGGAISGDLILTSQTRQFMSGNYDGEGHAITPANLASFFSGNPTQVLAEGDTLCVAYDKLTDTASNGGRRQAIPENANTAIPAGSYFNSRVHPELLFNALPICKVVSGSLVFSTGIEIPQGASNVGLSTPDPGSRIMRNGNFEHGVTADTTRFGITDWENRPDLAVNGAWRLNTTTPDTGAKHLEFNKTNVAASTTQVQQEQEIAVNPGQFVRVTCRVRQLIAPTAGTYSVVLYWGDADSAASSSSSVALQVLSSTDGAYRTVDQTVTVPGGKRFLKMVTVEVAGVTAGSTGVALLVDNLQVYVETQTGQTPAVDTTRMQARTLDALIVEDPLTYQVGQLAALARFTKAAPASEGKLTIERKDQDYTGGKLPPALEFFGRVLALGSKLLGSAADSRKARVEAPFDDTNKITLLWDTGPAVASDRHVRIYAGDLAHAALTGTGFILTINASFDGANWNKDVNGQLATAFVIDAGSFGFRVFSQVTGINTWASWTALMTLDPNGALVLFKDTGGFNVASVDVATMFGGTSSGPLSSIFSLDLGELRRANVAQIGTGDVLGPDIIDPHGVHRHNGEFFEEDFQGSTTGLMSLTDLAGTGSAVVNSLGSVALVTTGGSSGNNSVLRTPMKNQWSSDGTHSLGFRGRIRANDVTAAEQRFGFWSDTLGAPTVIDDTSMTGFKVINGVVTVVWIDSGGAHTQATGVTVLAGEWRWYSLNFDAVNQTLQWHVSAAGGNLTQGYVGGTYGEQPADNVNNTEDAYAMFHVKTTTGSAATGMIDYASAWSDARGNV